MAKKIAAHTIEMLKDASALANWGSAVGIPAERMAIGRSTLAHRVKNITTTVSAKCPNGRSPESGMTKGVNMDTCRPGAAVRAYSIRSLQRRPRLYLLYVPGHDRHEPRSDRESDRSERIERVSHKRTSSTTHSISSYWRNNRPEHEETRNRSSSTVVHEGNAKIPDRNDFQLIDLWI